MIVGKDLIIDGFKVASRKTEIFVNRKQSENGEYYIDSATLSFQNVGYLNGKEAQFPMTAISMDSLLQEDVVALQTLLTKIYLSDANVNQLESPVDIIGKV